MSRKLSLVLLCSAALMLFAAPALAVPITYTLEQGLEGSFGFSGLHDADDSTPMSGAPLGDLNGTLTLDYDAGFNNFTFVSSTVTLDSPDYTFELVGGVLSGSGGGFLSFELLGAGPFAQTGDIVFTPGEVCCGTDGPNRIDTTELRLWGAVDIVPSGQSMYKNAPKRFGMDLGASANAVPEPSAAMVFGIGIVLVRTAVRRRSS